jgi:hypothetical protein
MAERNPLTKDEFETATDVYLVNKKDKEDPKPATWEEGMYFGTPAPDEVVDEVANGAEASLEDPAITANGAEAAAEAVTTDSPATETADAATTKPKEEGEGTKSPDSNGATTDDATKVKNALDEVFLIMTGLKTRDIVDRKDADEGVELFYKTYKNLGIEKSDGPSDGPSDGQKGARRRTKRKGCKGAKKSKKSSQSQNGGRRRSSKNRRKHSHRRKH